MDKTCIDCIWLYRWMQHVVRVRSNCWHVERDMMWWQAVTSCGCYKLLTSCRSTVVPCQSCHWNLQKGAQLLWGRRANRMSRVWPCSQRCQDVPRCAKMCQDVPRQTSSNVKWIQMRCFILFHDVSSSGRWWFCVLDLQRVASIHWMW